MRLTCASILLREWRSAHRLRPRTFLLSNSFSFLNSCSRGEATQPLVGDSAYPVSKQNELVPLPSRKPQGVYKVPNGKRANAAYSGCPRGEFK
jgi:hypothetical protein